MWLSALLIFLLLCRMDPREDRCQGPVGSVDWQLAQPAALSCAHRLDCTLLPPQQRSGVCTGQSPFSAIHQAEAVPDKCYLHCAPLIVQHMLAVSNS